MGTEIVKKEDVMETFDKLDESQALAELKGASLQEYVYSFEDKGVKVTGLSLVGVRETVREMNKRGFSRTGIAERAPIINETDNYIEVQTYAKDELNGGGYWGIKRQDKLTRKKDGSTTPNRFCMEQALSKAQRNAMRGLIPEPFVKEMIATYLGQGKGRKVSTSEVQKSLADNTETSKTPTQDEKFLKAKKYWEEEFDNWNADPETKPETRTSKAGKAYCVEAINLYYFACGVLPKKEVNPFYKSTVDKTRDFHYGDYFKILKLLFVMHEELSGEKIETPQSIIDDFEYQVDKEGP